MSDWCPTGCGRALPVLKVMCGPCWRKVSKPLQQAVYRAWDARQDNPRDAAKVAAHEAAKAAAIRVATP